MAKTAHHSSFWIYCLGILVVAVVILIPLWRPGLIKTDDASWMVIRLSAFYQSLREGQFPVRFLGRLNYGYGYPVSNFLYPGFLYVGSLIHMLGFSFVDTVKVILSVSVAGFGLAVFFWLRSFFRALPSFVGAAAAMLAPYFSFDLYTRGSVGELFAFLWVGVCLAAIELGSKWLFIAGMTLLIVSHNSMALLFGLFIAVYLVATKKIRSYVVPTVLGAGMAAFFWIPAIHERKYVVFDMVAVSTPAHYFISLANLWLIGIVPVAVWITAAVKKVTHATNIRTFMLVSFVVSCVFALPVSSLLWQSGVLATLFQFPYRFLAVGVLAGSWLVAYGIQSSKRVGFVITLAGVVWVMQLSQTYASVTYDHEPEGFYTTNEATTTVQDEYMPRWVSQKPSARAGNRIDFFSGKGQLELHMMTSQRIDATVYAAEQSVVQLNTLYYPGWGVTVDGILTLPQYANRHGVMQVAIPAGTHRLVAEFRETVSRFLADALSGVSLCLTIVYVLFAERRKKLQKQEP